MGFFDSLTNERKLQAVEMRSMGFKEQLFGALIAAGLDPDSVDMETFNPETDIAEENAGWREQIARTIQALEKLEEIRERIGG